MATSTVNAQRITEKDGDEYGLVLREQFATNTQKAFDENVKLFPDDPGAVEPSGGKRWLANAVIKRKNTVTTTEEFYLLAESPASTRHRGGQRIEGQRQEVDRDTITLDATLLQSRELTIDTVEVSPFDAIPDMGKDMGAQLARDYDGLATVMGVLAARAPALTKNGQTIHNGGNAIERIGATGVADAYPTTPTGAANFRSDLRDLGELLDLDDIPREPGSRMLMVSPYIMNVLSNDLSLFHRDLSSMPGDMATQAMGMIDGFTLVGTTNRLPSTEIDEDDFGGDLEAKYHGDFRYNGSTGQPVALCLVGNQAAKALGLVVRRGIRKYMDPHDERYETVFMKATMRVGFDILHPWCAAEIRVTDS